MRKISLVLLLFFSCTAFGSSGAAFVYMVDTIGELRVLLHERMVDPEDEEWKGDWSRHFGNSRSYFYMSMEGVEAEYDWNFMVGEAFEDCVAYWDTKAVFPHVDYEKPFGLFVRMEAVCSRLSLALVLCQERSYNTWQEKSQCQRKEYWRQDSWVELAIRNII